MARKRLKSVDEVLERSEMKKSKASKKGMEGGEDDESMTLAEMKLEMKKNSDLEEEDSCVVRRKMGDLRLQKSGAASGPNSELQIMEVEDSDFYDFDKERVEKRFENGQVWAVYDDDDGMPRHYGLIDQVVSTDPFQVQMSWLDLQANAKDHRLLNCEKMGLHVSCGKFKASRKTTVCSVNIFSHVVDCERAAKELYRIYPTKGSVWALYAEHDDLWGMERRSLPKESRCYDIVVFLTSYSEVYGLSMAYLEKVDGYKTLFKRRQIGSRAIRLLAEDDVCLLSHQIPSRKLHGRLNDHNHHLDDDDDVDVPRDLQGCWELDPASLSSNLLAICRRR